MLAFRPPISGLPDRRITSLRFSAASMSPSSERVRSAEAACAAIEPIKGAQ